MSAEPDVSMFEIVDNGGWTDYIYGLHTLKRNKTSNYCIVYMDIANAGFDMTMFDTFPEAVEYLLVEAAKRRVTE